MRDAVRSSSRAPADSSRWRRRWSGNWKPTRPDARSGAGTDGFPAAARDPAVPRHQRTRARSISEDRMALGTLTLLCPSSAGQGCQGRSVLVIDTGDARRAVALPVAGSLSPAARPVLLDAPRGPRDGRPRRLLPHRPDGHGHPAARAQQAEPHPQPEGAGGPHDLPPAGARRRRRPRGLTPGRRGPARRRLGDARRDQSASRLLLHLGVRAGRALSRPGGPRRQLSRLRRRDRSHRHVGWPARHSGRPDRRHRRRRAHGGGRYPRGALRPRGDGQGTVRRHRHARRLGRLAGGERDALARRAP